MSDGVQARVAEVFRLEYGRVVASVLRIVRDIDTAEEVVQEAFAQALDRWPADGTPERPGAWLLTTARRRALDRLRHARRAGARADALAYEAALGAMGEGPEVTDPAEIPDDRLRLIFTCCHPGLPADSRVALTLRLVGGLSTAEIARAFLVPEPTIAQRLVRAKRTIHDRELPYEVQAAIAACHARAASWEATDWPRIVDLYRELADVAPSPVVELNRAVAIGLAQGAAAGLAALDGIESAALRGYHLLPAARADFLRRLGPWTEAAAEYRRALSLAENVREQRFLTARLAVW